MEASHSHTEGTRESSFGGKVFEWVSFCACSKRTLCSCASIALKRLLLFLFLLLVKGLLVTLPYVSCIRVFDTLPSIALQKNYFSFLVSWTRCLFQGLHFLLAHLEHIMLCHIHGSDWSLLSLLPVPFVPYFHVSSYFLNSAHFSRKMGALCFCEMMIPTYHGHEDGYVRLLI